MILVDPPHVEAWGRRWCHLASDASYDELHAFARAQGLPPRAFDRDHYDVPGELRERMVAAGAVPVTARELVARLRAAGLRRRRTQALGSRRPGRPLVRPRRLVPGDLVAVVAPAGPVEEARLAAGEDVLRSWGLRVRRVGATAGHADLPWLAGADDARAAALVEAWADPEVAALWVARGGTGTGRLLDALDWDALAGLRPPLVVGFSDATALHQALAARLGLAAVHGPGVAGLAAAAGLAGHDDASVAALRRLVLEGVVAPLAGEVLVPGEAEGPLVGGNVAVLAAGLGTPLVQPARGSVALLEDVGEAPHRLDRALTHLRRAGWFDEVRAVVCGTFERCGDAAHVRAVLRDRLGDLGVPVLLDLPVGHGPRNHPVVLGAPVRVEADAPPGAPGLVRPLGDADHLPPEPTWP